MGSKAKPPVHSLTYGSYLKIHELTALQSPLSTPAIHDEMQFIIVHQVFELWFKLALHELEAIFVHLKAGRTIEATRLFKRVESIVRCFLPSLEVIETMIPSDFVKFRDLLMPASGFQSWQFREMEFAAGLREERYLKMFEDNPEATKRLKGWMKRPTLWDAFVSHIQVRGYAVADETAQRAAVAKIYTDAGANDLMMLAEAMIELDEGFQLYREHHLRMAERMIGHKLGTGVADVHYAFGKQGPMGTQGVAYLSSTVKKKFFPVLWEARTAM